MLGQLQVFMNGNVLPFLKFFDGGLSDEDRKNYYLEREWRVLGSVSFEISDVCRVLIPEDYSSRFHRDFPAYSAQLSFTD